MIMGAVLLSTTAAAKASRLSMTLALSPNGAKVALCIPVFSACLPWFFTIAKGVNPRRPGIPVDGPPSQPSFMVLEAWAQATARMRSFRKLIACVGPSRVQRKWPVGVMGQKSS